MIITITLSANSFRPQNDNFRPPQLELDQLNAHTNESFRFYYSILLQLSDSNKCYLDNNQLTVHIEWVDSLLLFSHLYNNYDALATVQRHQMG